MSWNHWLSRFAPCSLLNPHATKRRTGTRGVDPAIPVAAQILELEARVLPATIVVTTTADTINAGDGVISLREAVIQANTNAGNDTILLAAGTYTLTRAGANEDSASTGDLDILNNGTVTITGAGANLTTISATGLNDRVLHVISGATLTVFGVTISGGTVSSEGGGILSQGSTTISNSTISGNTGSYGGGVEQIGGTLVIAHSTISGNTATVNGGGIDYYQCTVTITNTTISGNSAKFSGGGLFTDASTGTIANSTLTNNRADSLGGSGWHGGAISVQGGTLTLRNTIAAGNFVGTGTTANDVTGSLAGASAFNLIADSGTAGGLTNGNNGNIVGVDPATVLDPILTNNGGPTLTHALIPGSLAINAGDPVFDVGSLPNDQRGAGFDRVLLGGLDIGAVEAHNTVPTLESTPSTTTFSKKAAKLNGAPQIVPNIVVTDPDTATGTKLGGGILAFEMVLQGKQHKQKGFLSYDTIGGLEGSNAIGTFNGPTQDGNRFHYQFSLHAETTVAQVQSFLRGLTFSTKGKGAKVDTRLFRVQVADAAFDVSIVIDQTINVGK